jgi:hypothetical protein
MVITKGTILNSTPFSQTHKSGQKKSEDHILDTESSSWSVGFQLVLLLRPQKDKYKIEFLNK